MRYVYIDEAGNKDINVPKDGATDFYVVAAAIVRSDALDEFERRAESLAHKHFNGSQIKSSNVGKNAQRRERVLEDLVCLPAHYYGLVIDKRRLHKESGLQYGGSFYKRILRIAHEELFASFSELDVTIDDHGTEEFKSSFLDYIRRHFDHDLFSGNDRRFSPSGASRGVQVADFVAGSLMKAVEEQVASGDRPAYFQILEPRLTYYSPWPREQFPYHLEPKVENPEDRFDPELIDLGLQRAHAYLAGHEGAQDPDQRARIVTLQRLLCTFRGETPLRYLSGAELKEHIAAHLPQLAVSDQSFMNKVIAPLRDAGILVVASERGYKLPVSISEVVLHMNNTCSKIVPMVRRLGRVREAVRMATGGRVDPFARPEFAFLGHVLDEVESPAAVRETG